MDQEIKKIRKLTYFMKKEGVLSLKMAETEIHLSPQALFQKEEISTQSQTPVVVESEKPLTEEDLLFWSAPGVAFGS